MRKYESQESCKGRTRSSANTYQKYHCTNPALLVTDRSQLYEVMATHFLRNTPECRIEPQINFTIVWLLTSLCLSRLLPALPGTI